MELFRCNLFSRIKRIKQIHAHNQEILLIFCSIPSKKIGNPTSPVVFLASAQTISTPTEIFLLLRIHRELRTLARSDAICSYSLSNSIHIFHSYCSFYDKPSIQTWLWLPVVLLAIPAGENSKPLCWLVLKIASKIAIFLHRKWKFMSFEGEMTQTAKHFDVIETHVFPWEWPPIHTSSERISPCFCMLHTNVCPSVKCPYSKMRAVHL